MDAIKIIENGFVVTCDGFDHAGRFAILVKGDRIAELNPLAAGLRARYPNAEIVDASDKVILPGFVDAHYHGESFALRTWTAGTPLSRWQKSPEIRQASSYLHREASKEELAPLYRAAYFSALKSGVTTIAEFGFDHLDVPFSAAREALKRTDLRGYVGIHNSEQMDHARANGAPGGRSALVLPGEDDLTLYNMQTTIRMASEMQWPIIAHLGETRQGHDAVRRNFNRSIMRVLDEFRILHQPIQLVHTGPMDGEDLEVLSQTRVPVIVCPTALFAKQTDPPPVAAFLDRGIPVALGSDWGVPDPFENMRQFLRLAGVDDPGPLGLLRLHTINGARALMMQDETGSIEGGKKADLTFVDASDLRHLLPLESGDPVRFLRAFLQTCSSQAVSDVMINGDFFLRKGQIMTYAEEDLKREYREAMAGLLERMTIPGAAPVPAAPIIPLRQEEPAANAGTEAGSFDEGFRIIGTTGSLPRSSVNAGEPLEQPPRELPKTVRKTFGDDDL